jgi:hypothetical protein
MLGKAVAVSEPVFFGISTASATECSGGGSDTPRLTYQFRFADRCLTRLLRVSEFEPLSTGHSSYVTFKLVQEVRDIRARVFTPRPSRLYYAALGKIGKWRMTD